MKKVALLLMAVSSLALIPGCGCWCNGKSWCEGKKSEKKERRNKDKCCSKESSRKSSDKNSDM